MTFHMDGTLVLMRLQANKNEVLSGENMYYCEGKYCSIKDKCEYHKISESDGWVQYLDQSTEGFGCYGEDENGNSFSHHEYNCGDRASKYSYYKNCED